MTRNARITFCLSMVLTSVMAIAQMSAPTPAPELKKLDYFRQETGRPRPPSKTGLWGILAENS